MRLPSAADLVRVWELGRNRESWYRGLLMLAPAFPDTPFGGLAGLTVGQRNTALFTLRELLFEAELEGVVTCACGTVLEFPAHLDHFCADRPNWPAVPPPPPGFDVTLDGFELRCRCLDSRDLAANPRAAALSDPDLLRSCVVEARAGAEPIAPGHLPAAIAADLHDALLDHDPMAERPFDIACFHCGREWTTRFDIVDFLWAELTRDAQRLLNDVHVLADAYGWREADILAMSNDRRRFYLERAST